MPQVGMMLRERKRKPVPDADEANENAAPKPKRARAPGRPKGSPNKQRANPAGDAESELLARLRSGTNMGKLVNEWIREYDENPDEAIVKILQLFISATGCKGSVTAVQIRSIEYKHIIDELAGSFAEDCNEYPLMMSGQQWRKFRSLFGDFIMVFVSKIKSDIIHHNNFADYILELLIGLADSSIRAFRHTATFAAMKFSSALVDVVVELVDLKEKNNRQVEAEKTKLKQRGTNERLDALMEAKNDLEKKISDLCLMIQHVFKSVFTHRYRDLVSDIRCICITEIGNWMRAYPILFLEDSYLKYIGWSLFDKNAEVRTKCVEVLLPLYERTDLTSRLELFTSRFKGRIVPMVTDKEVEVAIQACQLVSHIHRAFPRLLEASDCVAIYETVYCSYRPLAVAAGEFVNARVFQQVDSSGNEVAGETLIKSLVEFFIEGEVHNHPAYLVDALIDTCPMLKDWFTMTEMLLIDKVGDNDGQLIELMTVAVKQAATGELPTGRTLAKKAGAATAAAKEPRALQEERIRITEAFIPTLPRLINKFSHDSQKAAALTLLPLYFDLDIYQVGRHERELDDLMDALHRVFEQHSDDETLQNVVKVLRYFDTSAAVSQHTETKRTQLIDQIAMQFRQATADALQELGEQQLDEEDEAKVAVSFRKLNALFLVFELRNVDVWDPVMRVVDSRARFQAADIVDKGLSLLFSVLSHEVIRSVQGKETKASISKIRKRRDEFLQRACGIMEVSAVNVEHAFFTMCDMLILCNYKLRESSERAAELVVNLDARTIAAINSFVVNNVFEVSHEEFEKLDQQAQIELTCKRRVVLGHYCKLVIYGLLPIVDMSLVLRYYVRYYSDYGDILKHVLGCCRDMDRLLLAQAIVRTLRDVYEEMRVSADDDAGVDTDTAAFNELHDLAKRFAAFFTAEQSKNREAVALIHHTGIRYALGLDTKEAAARPGRRAAADADADEGERRALSFLAIVQEFSSKLLRHDKVAIHKYLIEHAPADDADEHAEQEALHAYKDSLSTSSRTN